MQKIFLMIVFPNAKINLGLSVGDIRPDGYHDIVSVIVPVTWTDVLEVTPSPDDKLHLQLSGREVNCPMEKNLVVKAFHEFARQIPIAPVSIYLRKIIPDGAGLGGGSADAAFMLTALSALYEKDLSVRQLEQMASALGSDCPLFINNRPTLVTGRGTTLHPAPKLPLGDKHILIVKPPKSVSTAEAYQSVSPSRQSPAELEEILVLPIEQWQSRLINDFELSVVEKVPEVALIKNWMLNHGAVYAAMSGSGSAVFGIFPTDKMTDSPHSAFPDSVCHWCKAILD